MASLQARPSRFRAEIKEIAMTSQEPDDLSEDGPGEAGQRLDKWLWFARMAKTRSLAQRLVTDGDVRVNRDRVTKPAHILRLGDLLTVSLGKQLRLLKVAGFGSRRGPAPEAVLLYDDLAPPPDRAAAKGDAPDADLTSAGLPQREAGSGRPTKRDRRRMDRLLGD
jgi:ribosome-associated heat shock protein Hsp15